MKAKELERKALEVREHALSKYVSLEADSNDYSPLSVRFLISFKNFIIVSEPLIFRIPPEHANFFLGVTAQSRQDLVHQR